MDVQGNRGSRDVDPAASDRDPWMFRFPNAADFNFNYWKLLNEAYVGSRGVAEAPPEAISCRIAIVGAGIAGLTAARELYRAGYQNIDLYESSARIGGRTYTETCDVPGDRTPFEMGAMRLPFFSPFLDESTPESGIAQHEGDGGPGSQNSVTDYFCTEFGIATEAFPNPGEVSTGIYVNRGYGPAPKTDDDRKEKATLIHSGPGTSQGSNQQLADIHSRWKEFTAKFQRVCRHDYGSGGWPARWEKIASEYRGMSFRDFVVADATENETPGELGGLGLNQEQSRVFAVVGMGDGGWGAFYDVSCLYVLRIFMFGFADQLQLIRGVEHPLPFGADDEMPRDSLNQRIRRPSFLGVQAIAECLFYRPASMYDQSTSSLYDAVRASRTKVDGVHLFLRTAVRRVHLYWRRTTSDPKYRHATRGSRLTISTDGRALRTYDHVIVTAMPWSLEVESGFYNFPPRILPHRTRIAMRSSHFITSCKVFFPLRDRYWEKDPRIPQVIVTDTFLQGAYGIPNADHKPGGPGYAGVLLASYTWEDDATRLLADDDAQLAQRCLDELDRILTRCRVGKVSPFVIDTPRVHHWERSPSYRGCARLYRPGSWDLDYALLTYNQQHSRESHLYLAGEAYSVEGGWVEPALRSALDAVIHLVRNTGGRFPSTFKYPEYVVSEFG
jgi:tryptophan 2-monooxygenase